MCACPHYFFLQVARWFATRAAQVDAVTGSLQLAQQVIDAGLTFVGHSASLSALKEAADQLQAATSVGELHLPLGPSLQVPAETAKLCHINAPLVQETKSEASQSCCYLLDNGKQNRPLTRKVAAFTTVTLLNAQHPYKHAIALAIKVGFWVAVGGSAWNIRLARYAVSQLKPRLQLLLEDSHINSLAEDRQRLAAVLHRLPQEEQDAAVVELLSSQATSRLAWCCQLVKDEAADPQVGSARVSKQRTCSHLGESLIVMNTADCGAL